MAPECPTPAAAIITQDCFDFLQLCGPATRGEPTLKMKGQRRVTLLTPRGAKIATAALSRQPAPQY